MIAHRMSLLVLFTLATLLAACGWTSDSPTELPSFVQQDGNRTTIDVAAATDQQGEWHEPNELQYSNGQCEMKFFVDAIGHVPAGGCRVRTPPLEKWQIRRLPYLRS